MLSHPTPSPFTLARFKNRKFHPSSSSITWIASFVGYDGTASQSFSSSNKKAVGIRSGRIDKACPNLMKEGPSRVNASRSKMAYFRCKPSWLKIFRLHEKTFINSPTVQPNDGLKVAQFYKSCHTNVQKLFHIRD